MTAPVVLVPLDGSRTALGALPVARRLAELAHASIRIVHITEENRPLHETAEQLGLATADLRGATLEARAGAPGEAIVAAAADRRATLIVMGADIANAGAVGDAPLAVLRHAECPVVIVNSARPSSGWAIKRVLAPHDGSPAVSDALRPAAELARAGGAEFVVLHASDDASALEAGSIAPPMYLDQLQYGWPAWSGEFLQRLACVCPLADAKVRLVVGRGQLADETIRMAQEESADLIALAWKGPLDAPDASALKALLQGAPCPVMVMRIASA